MLFFLSIAFFMRTKQYEAVWDDERGHFTEKLQAQMDHDIPAFWKDHSGMYIPLTYSTWAVVKRIVSPHAFEPSVFHVLNAMTHSLNGVLLFFLLLLLFKNKTTAFLGALLFLVHPLQVEAVAWISEFRGLYSTCFCLISMLLLFKDLEKARPSTGKELVFSKGFLFAFFFFLLALLAKPSGIVLPFIILALAWRFYKEQLLVIVKSLVLWLIPAIIIAVLLLVKNMESTVPFFQRLLIAGYSFAFYLEKIVVPYPLVACYGFTPELILNTAFPAIGFFVSLIIFSFLIYKRNKLPNLFTGFLIIFICVLPVLGLIPFEYQKHSTVADRYMYMGFIGVALFVPVVEDFARKYVFVKWLSIAVFPLFAILTVKQINTWENEFEVWDHALAYYDNSSKVYYNRGVQYTFQKDFKDALADYSRALELDPDNLDALFNRANAYENLGNVPAAFKDYAAYLKKKKDPEVYYKRSYLYLKSGDLNGAFDDLQRAEEMRYPVDPRYKSLLLKLKTQQ